MGNRGRQVRKHDRGQAGSHQLAENDRDETTNCQTKCPCFGDIRFYTAVFTLLTITSGMYWGCISGVLAFIERRYQMSSSMSGFMLTSPEIGRLALVIFTSHFGNRFNKARVVGVTYTLVGIAVFGQTLPHYLIKPESSAAAILGNVTDFSTHNLCAFNSSANDVLSTPGDEEMTGNNINTNAAYGLFVAFCLMMGASASSYFSMGLVYIEENSHSTQAGKLLGYTTCGWELGQMFGMFLAAWCATIYVDLDGTLLTPEDPAWIGAWWLGLLIISVCQCTVSPLHCFFPRRIPVKAVSISVTEMEMRLSSVPLDNTGTDSKAVLATNEARLNVPLTKNIKSSINPEMNVMYDFKGLLKALNYLMTKPVYMFLVLGLAISNLHVGGFYMFVPKYTETQFSIPASMAILSVGIMSGIGNGVAALIGGQIITWLKLTVRGMFLMLLALSMISLLCSVATIFLGCDSVAIDGVSATNSDLPTLMPCSAACQCDLSVYEPVCDNGLTYFSPCHAGCVAHNITEEGRNSMFLTCMCTETGTALKGACTDDCNMLIPFMFTGGGMFLAYAALQVAINLLILRVVPRCYASLSIGVSTMANALFGWMPGVALYGVVIDTTCLVWEETSSGEPGFCWIYDLPAFRYKVMGVNTGCLVVLLVFSFISFMLHRRKMYTAV